MSLQGPQRTHSIVVTIDFFSPLPLIHPFLMSQVFSLAPQGPLKKIMLTHEDKSKAHNLLQKSAK